MSYKMIQFKYGQILKIEIINTVFKSTQSNYRLKVLTLQAHTESKNTFQTSQIRLKKKYLCAFILE